MRSNPLQDMFDLAQGLASKSQFTATGPIPEGSVHEKIPLSVIKGRV